MQQATEVVPRQGQHTVGRGRHVVVVGSPGSIDGLKQNVLRTANKATGAADRAERERGAADRALKESAHKADRAGREQHKQNRGCS